MSDSTDIQQSQEDSTNQQSIEQVPETITTTNEPSSQTQQTVEQTETEEENKVEEQAESNSPTKSSDTTTNSSLDNTLYEENKLFVGGINRETKNDGYYELFSKYGKIVDHVLMRGFGFITYENSSSCEEVLSEKNLMLDNKRLDVKRAKLRNEAQKDSNITKIYIQGLSPDADEESVKKHFEQFGTLKDVNLLRHKDTQSLRGFGFITYENAEGAQKASKVSKQLINGQKIHVEIAKARPKNFNPFFNNRQNQMRFQQQYNPRGYGPVPDYVDPFYRPAPYNDYNMPPYYPAGPSPHSYQGYSYDARGPPPMVNGYGGSGFGRGRMQGGFYSQSQYQRRI